jgi:hypothetical protein
MPKNKDFEVKRNFCSIHLDRQRGLRGRKPWRISLSEDLLTLGRKLGIKTYIDR